MSVKTKSAKEQLCLILYKIGALEFGTFKLAGGKISPYYIDLRIVPSFPDAFHEICDIYTQLIRENVGADSFDRIAGIPTGGIPFASVLAHALHKPFLYTRKAERKHGRERRVEGILMPGDKVLLIDDLITSGKSLLEAADRIQAEGGIIQDAIVLISREEGGKANLAERKIALHYLLKASEAAATLHQIGAITDLEMKTILKQRREK